MMWSALHDSLFMLGLLAGYSACSDSTNRIFVDVEVGGASTDVSILQVHATLSGRAGTPEGQLVSEPPFSFVLSLPSDAAGPLELNVDGLDSAGCVVAQGSAQSEIVDAAPSPIRVQLERVPICLFVANTKENVVDVWGSNPSDVWAVGAKGIRHWNGVNWAPVSLEEPIDLKGIWGSGPSDVWAVGRGNVFLHWDGVSWTRVNSGAAGSQNFEKIWGSGPDDAWAVGGDSLTPYQSVILHWNGASWNRDPFLDYGVLKGIWGSGPNDIWAVGNSILHWDGALWNRVFLPYVFSDPQKGVWGSGPDDVWIVGDLILHWNGVGWISVPSFTTATFEAVSGSGPNDVWAVGNNLLNGWHGRLVHWNGVGWSIVSSLTQFRLEGIWSSGPNTGWAVGDEILRFKR